MVRALVVAAATLGLAACGGGDSQLRAGPSQAPQECGTYSGRGCAPPGRRVDLAPPSFSDPTRITNPLNPIGELRSALLLGHVEGRRLRVETTLLPGTRGIRIGGQTVHALASQYVAWVDGRIEEVALDWYAQDDAGAVWYLGEDVFNYDAGAVADTEGTWLAGRDGPAAMIMPAEPRLDDVYRPENVPGIVFEEVTVREIGKRVRGPRGPVDGAIVVDELHVDGGREDKTFAPGYGEFRTGSKTEVEALALAVPTDALDGPAPEQLDVVATGARGLLGSAQAEDWAAARAALKRMRAAWNAVKPGRPPLLAAQTDGGLRRLRRAIRARSVRRAATAAIDLGLAALDLALQYRPPVDVDRARFDLWASKVLVDAAARDRAAVAGDVASLEWIRDRFAHALEPADRAELDAGLRATRAAADAGNLRAAGDHAARTAARLRGA